MAHGKVKFAKGIEIGQIFKLGTIYSEKMNGTYLDENGKAKPYIMGCYGIGVSRLIAAIIEQNNDENGIIWPKEVAPYLVHLVCLDMKKDVQKETAEKIYNKLLEEKVEVLYDDIAADNPSAHLFLKNGFSIEFQNDEILMVKTVL